MATIDADRLAADHDRAVKHGRLIRERRLDLGLKRPAFVSELARHGVDITPDYLNKIESGVRPLANAAPEIREAIRAVMGWNPEKWFSETGLYVPGAAQEPARPLTHAEQRGWVMPEEEEEEEIPDSLQAAIDLYAHGDNAAMAEPRWIRTFTGNDFREVPETPEDWLALFARLKKLINPR